MGVLERMQQAVIDGNLETVKAEVKQALAEGVPPEQILNQGMILAMDEVGRRFQANEFFVPEMLVAARAMKGGLELLRPRLAEAKVKATGKVVIGTVKGDLHDIGKNLVSMMLEGAGFEVVDAGIDVAPDKFVEAVKEHRPDLVGFSALLTTTMPMIKSNIEALRAAGLRDGVIVMIGGAPITSAFAKEVGADFYAPDASSAAKAAKQAMVSRPR
jgi:5-methyltetrahydrofolate--homocysteine methyltransferase